MTKANTFKTLGEAQQYCNKFGLPRIPPLEAFDFADALHRAFVAGQESTECPQGKYHELAFMMDNGVEVQVCKKCGNRLT